MGALAFLTDRLANVMSGRGTSVDRRTGNQWLFTPVTPQQAEAAYRTSWLVRKIVDIPALDMTREWRDWQAEGSDIEAIEREEKRLELKAKCKRALTLARLYGGGAILLGTNDSNPMEPLNADRVQKGGLTYLHVMSRHQLTLGQQIMDPASPWFGQPSYFELAGAGSRVRVHPSRIVAFVGQTAPEGSFYQQGDWFWGDPIMQSIEEAVNDASTAMGGFASLIDEAKIDIVSIPDLTGMAATAELEQRLTNRLTAASMGKSTWRTLFLDAAEKWEQKQVTWTGMPDVIMTYLQIVSGAADIPATRLLGQSPKGLQSNGDGEERDYHAMVKARQEELLAPALDRIDDLLIRSALGNRPSDIYYEFAPLGHTNEKEAADIEKTFADAAKVYSDTALIPDQALSAMVKNRVVESGRWPGSEKAFEEAEAAGDTVGSEADLTTAAERLANLEKAGAITGDQAVSIMADAAPRTLYVQRKLLNAPDLIKWARSQGFDTTLPADDMHVTVLYSRSPVDWMQMGSAWEGDENGNLTVQPGGARIVEPLGDKGAVVLLFNSSALSWRHEDMVRNGASHDFDTYQPHVTLTYAMPDGLDLDKVEPYRGKLVFGPETFEELDEDWQAKLTEA